tara:strand:- start:3581 stop:4051 length:471 start_codon:yes stop_codon:yes gene_type:complete
MFIINYIHYIIIMQVTKPGDFNNRFDTLKIRWKNATKQYIDTFPKAKLNIDKTSNSRAYNSIINTKKDINIIFSELDGDVNNLNKFLNNKDIQIQTFKNKYNNSKIELESQLGNNYAGKPRKLDKHIENSESYMISSFYLISIGMISFFIYKQIKE